MLTVFDIVIKITLFKIYLRTVDFMKATQLITYTAIIIIKINYTQT